MGLYYECLLQATAKWANDLLTSLQLLLFSNAFFFSISLSKLSACPLCLFSPQALNKKEHRGCDSPDADASYVLTPNTEEKYKKINEEFDNMMKSHKIVSCIVIFSLPPLFYCVDADQSVAE